MKEPTFRVRVNYRPLRLIAFRVCSRATLFALFAALFASRVSATSVRALSLEDRVRQASDILVATVLDAKSRWSSGTPRFIETVFTLRIEDGVVGTTLPGDLVTLTMWGGTIGNQSQGAAGIRTPRAGGRYLLMLAPQWRTQNWGGIVGVDQGLFEIQSDSGTGAERILDFKRDTVHNTALSASGDNVGSVLSLSDFVTWIQAVHRTNADRTMAAPPGETLGVPKTIRPETVSDGVAATATPIMFKVRDRILWNQYTYDSSYYLTDVREMVKWNVYSDVFMIFQDPTGDRRWGNGRSETHGLLNDQQMRAVFGRPWANGELAVCFFTTIDGYHYESDIALNAGVDWTFDDEAVFSRAVGPNTYPYRQAMLHELGHAVGLDHEFNQLSVMNYAPQQFRSYALPFMSDAEGIRTTASAHVTPRTDLAVYQFQSTGYQRWDDALFTPVVVAGQAFAMRRFYVENAGTTTVVNPALNWYLTPQRYYTQGAIPYLGRTVFNVTLPRSSALPTELADVTLHVPSDIDGGAYFVSGLTDGPAGGARQTTFPFAHNAGFTRQAIRVYPAMNAVDAPWLVGGQQGVATLYLRGKTDELGMDVQLRSSAPGVVAVPASVRVPPGVTEVSFPIASMPVASMQDVTITARVLSTETSGLSRVFPTGIAITSPTSQAQWAIGTQHVIRWTHGFGDGSMVRVALSRDSGDTYSEVLAAFVRNNATTGELAWVVTGPVTAAARLRISFGNTSVAEMPFSIVLPPAILTVSAHGSGTVRTDDGFIQCPAVACSHAYAAGTTVTIHATPATGFVFAGWSSNACSSGTVLMTADRTCTATFLRTVIGRPKPGSVNLNGSGLGDVFTYNPRTGVHTSQYSDGQAHFGETRARVQWAANWQVYPADFNGDGLTDFFLYNATSGQWYKAVNNKAGDFSYFTGRWIAGWQVFIVDLNGDHHSDAFLSNPATGDWYRAVSAGDGTGDFAYVAGHWIPGWQIYPADLNGDGVTDFFLYNPSSGNWYQVVNDGVAGFQYTAGTWAIGWSITPGDFNGDGRTDFFLSRASTGEWYVATTLAASGFAYGSGRWAAGWTFTPGDFNADGKTDLFLYNPTSGGWFEAFSTGAGGFTLASGNWAANWQVQVTDFNGDGWSDVLLYNPASGQWYQAMNAGIGTFTYGTGLWEPELTIVATMPRMP